MMVMRLFGNVVKTTAILILMRIPAYFLLLLFFLGLLAYSLIHFATT